MASRTLPFEYISCLGQGSYAIVLKANNSTTDFHSAVKIIFKNDQDMKYLKRESEIMKDKSHPNVVKVLNVFKINFTKVGELEEIAKLFGYDDIHNFDAYIGRIRRKKTLPAILIEMELCGATLSEWLYQNVNHDKNDSKLQMKQINIIQDMISGVQFLHKNQIIHRDIKPTNFMFSVSNEDDRFPFPLKIGDFGLSRILHSEETQTSTLTSRIGTLDYMAPEMDGNSYNFQSDIFSLGLVIWEVVQLMPFTGRKKLFSELVYYEKTELVVSFEPSISSTIISMTNRRLEDRMESIFEVDGVNDPITEFMNQLNQFAEQIKVLIDDGHIEYISTLGWGSYGIVLKAKMKGSLSAVKIIFSSDQESKNLERECEIMKGKFHPNVVNVLNVSETVFTTLSELEEIAKLVDHPEILDKLAIYMGRIRRSKTLPAILIEMELCGLNLREWLNQYVNHDKEDSKLQSIQIHIIKDMVSGMKYLHENKIIHRDFKPENVMFSPSNKDKFPFPLKIGDFGLSRILESEGSETYKLTSKVGTCEYRSPEMKKDAYNFQSDIYSLGLVIWEVAQLIPIKTREELFLDLVNDKKTNLVSTFLPSISSTIIKMTKKDLSDRKISIIEVESILNDTANDPSKDRLELKDQVIPFEFISCLGFGSFGVVLKAKDPADTNFMSAVKIIFSSGNSINSQESEIMKLKNHPNVVQTKKVFETIFKKIEDLNKISKVIKNESIQDFMDTYMQRIRRKTIPAILIEMELCGPTLREWLNQHVNHDKKKFNLQFTQIHIIKDMINGMKFLHENKIIHHDLKPENVMFSLPNEYDQFPFPLKIGDFGLSRILGSDENRTYTQTNRMGTLTYMAPEIDGSSYNYQSDIYSLGLVIFEVVQLMPINNRKKFFVDLVFEEKTEIVDSFLPSISSIIISMTKRKLEDRMESLTEVDQI